MLGIQFVVLMFLAIYSSINLLLQAARCTYDSRGHHLRKVVHMGLVSLCSKCFSMELLCESQNKSKRNGRSKGRGAGENFADVFIVWGTNLTSTVQTSVKFHDFAELLYISVCFLQITFKLGNFIDFKVCFAN